MALLDNKTIELEKKIIGINIDVENKIIIYKIRYRSLVDGNVELSSTFKEIKLTGKDFDTAKDFIVVPNKTIYENIAMLSYQYLLANKLI